MLSAGFTLLEILVVLVIIGLLAGLVGPRLLSQVTAAEAQIKTLRGTLQTMRLDLGRFPKPEEGLGLLVTAPVDAVEARRWAGPYLDGSVPLDPWGNAYQYAVPGQDSQPFALYSFGADGKQGGSGVDADIGILPIIR